MSMFLLFLLACLERQNHPHYIDDDGDGYTEMEGDCDDDDAILNPQDQDGDGQSTCFGDCDDADPKAYLGAAEQEAPGLCMRDFDEDGYGDDNPTLFVTAGTDCDDSDSTINPDASEVTADGTDQDCDGFERCYVDADEDGFRTIDTSRTVASSGVDCNDSGAGSVSDPATDCDDRNSMVFPGAPERCDGWDNDCNGTIEEEIEVWSFNSDLGATYDVMHSFSGHYSAEEGVCNGGIENNGILSTNSGSLDQYSEGFTIAVWAKGSGAILAKSSSGHAAPEEFAVNGGDDLRFTVNWPGLAYGASQPEFNVSGHCNTREEHRFVVGTAAPNASLRLYCDGQEIASDPNFTHMVWSGRPLYIGANPAGGLETGSYSLDELKLYRCALDANSIEAHYDCGGCGCDVNTSPCASSQYWNGERCVSP